MSVKNGTLSPPWNICQKNNMKWRIFLWAGNPKRTTKEKESYDSPHSLA